MGTDQRSHWNSIFREDSDRFGSSPSTFCEACYGIIRAEGGRDLLELGAGQGRDACLFSEKGLNVTTLDYSEISCDQLKRKLPEANVLQGDVRRGIDLPDDAFDVCYSHMLFTMDLRDSEIECITADLKRIVRKGGLIMMSVRRKDDACYGKGVNLHSDVWEYNGFAVRYFSREDLKILTGRFAVEEIFEFKEEGRSLFGAVLRNTRG